MSNHFTITINTCNHEIWVERCINSCLVQKYDNFDVVLVDAHSDDKSFEIAMEYEATFTNFKAHHNEVRLPAVANLFLLAKLSKPNSIIVMVDGDDFLKGPNVLQKLNKYYGDNNDVWMTYGSYVEWPSLRSVVAHYRAHTAEEIANNTFREAPWLASHLRTYRRELVMRIDENDAKDERGNWLYAADQAIMLPCLEMAGVHSRFIPDILYYYNIGDPNRETVHHLSEQVKHAKYIRMKKKYQALETL